MFEIPFILFISFWLAVVSAGLILLPFSLLADRFPKFFRIFENFLKGNPNGSWNVFSVLFIILFINFVMENLFELNGLGLTEFYFDVFTKFLIFVFDDLPEILHYVIFYLILAIASFRIYKKFRR